MTLINDVPLSIYGAGHLADALLEGLGTDRSRSVCIYNRTRARAAAVQRRHAMIGIAECPEDLVSSRCVVFLMVPPIATLELCHTLVERIRSTGSLLVSCANGVAIATLELRYPGVRIVRALPNVNWRCRDGVTLLQFGTFVTGEDRQVLYALVSPISHIRTVLSEGDFDALGCVTACGPGLIAQFILEICRAFGVAGADRVAIARVLSETAALLIKHDGQLDAVIRDVANPEGLTAVGIATIQELLPCAIDVARERMNAKIDKRRDEIGLIIDSIGATTGHQG